MVIRLIELGPFGCRIDRGIAETLQDIPEGYENKGVKVDTDPVTVFIEPKTTKDAEDPKSDIKLASS